MKWIAWWSLIWSAGTTFVALANNATLTAWFIGVSLFAIVAVLLMAVFSVGGGDSHE